MSLFFLFSHTYIHPFLSNLLFNFPQSSPLSPSFALPPRSYFPDLYLSFTPSSHSLLFFPYAPSPCYHIFIFYLTFTPCSRSSPQVLTFISCLHPLTMVQNNQKYWATHSSIRSFAHTAYSFAHSFACGWLFVLYFSLF